MGKPRPRRIQYIPGIISLLILPFLLHYSAKRIIAQTNYYALPLYWLPPKLEKSLKEDYGEFPVKRNYLDIHLRGDADSDNKRLDFAQVRLREILRQNDSVNGIRFHFGKNSNYGSFIKAVDICNIENAKTYVIKENDLWVYHIPPDTSMQTFVCGTEYTLIDEPPSWTERVEEYILKAWQTSWPIVSGYMVLLLFSVRYLTRRYKRQVTSACQNTG